MLVSIGRRAKQPESLVGLLEECHERIRSFTQLALLLGTRAELPESEIIAGCQRVQRYFTQALPLHVADEEESLAPRLIGRSAAVDETLRTMQAQHTAHEQSLAAMLDATRALQNAPRDYAACAHLAVCAEALRAEFDVHLALEEAVLFPAIELLPPEDQDRIILELRARRGSAQS